MKNMIRDIKIHWSETSSSFYLLGAKYKLQNTMNQSVNYIHRMNADMITSCIGAINN